MSNFFSHFEHNSFWNFCLKFRSFRACFRFSFWDVVASLVFLVSDEQQSSFLSHIVENLVARRGVFRSVFFSVSGAL